MRKEDRILIVENDAAIAREIESAGEQLQVVCDRATDGWDAISKLEEGDYVAIVIDADVPRHSGYGVLTYLREEVGEAMDNVIFMTSSDHGAVSRKFGQKIKVVDKADAVAEIARVVNGSN